MSARINQGNKRNSQSARKVSLPYVGNSVIFLLSLSVLVHAIGDASEITQNSTDKKLRMVEKETDCRLKHLQVNVERLKSILLTSDLGRL